ncbi:hypothetical protein [Tenacibaculum retecalamus]|uniref:hypothetical protein n=1 Tax=Tenacibaculum retecalamus TaxID=3018315 RepID=UPI0023D944CD|nr:hypothetical protein [Tenacibaculum retecalamus]WBX72347.1 hypothetical protein PG912_06325 [Tenacibaculum retecalamus]
MEQKITLAISFLFFNVFLMSSQSQVEISLLKYSEAPNSKKEQIHKIQIKNTSNETALYNIVVSNSLCKNQKNIETALEYSLFDENMLSIKNVISIASNSKKTLHIKITKPYNAKLDSWNCSQIEVYKNQSSSFKNSSAKTSSSVKLTLKTFIPNTKNYN